MCRAAAYMGPPIKVSALLHQPDNALVRQFSPQQHAMLNLAGFGLMAWSKDDDDREPLVYRSTTVPIYDNNLDSLAKHVRANTALAHVRGIPYRPSGGYGPQNLHPFRYPGARVALAHNGDLTDFERMRLPLLQRIKPEIAVNIRGTIDSEYTYALFLSQLEDPGAKLDADEVHRALNATLAELREVRRALGIDTRSSLNLFLCDEDLLVGARFTFDYGRYPLTPDDLSQVYAPFLGLWYTAGAAFEDEGGVWRMTGGADHAEAVMVASEPLTQDTSGWVEVPEYSAVIAVRDGDAVSLEVRGLDA